jgi:hypothetical protein
MLYCCKDPVKLREFEEKLRARFNLELIGQVHWYLGTRINQLASYDIELDQSRYLLHSHSKKVLGCSRSSQGGASSHSTPRRISCAMQPRPLNS